MDGFEAIGPCPGQGNVPQFDLLSPAVQLGGWGGIALGRLPEALPALQFFSLQAHRPLATGLLEPGQG